MPDNNSPTWQNCVDQQRTCQNAVFAKIDSQYGKLELKINTQYEKIESAINTINKRLDIRDGGDVVKASIKAITDSQLNSPVQSRGGTLKRFSWEKVAAVLVIVTSAVFAGIAALKERPIPREEIIKLVRTVLQEKSQP
jgi:hypothetical protein